MSSLRFTKPLRIKGLPEEAVAEWEGLNVGLASMFPYYIGSLAEEPARIWDDDKKSGVLMVRLSMTQVNSHTV